MRNLHKKMVLVVQGAVNVEIPLLYRLGIVMLFLVRNCGMLATQSGITRWSLPEKTGLKGHI